MSYPFARTPEERIAKAAKKCTHFNGVQHKVCEAGVSYESLPKESNLRTGFVCFGEVGGCDKFKATGIEEATKLHERQVLGTQNMIKARMSIVAKEGKNRCVRGKIDCPVCSGKETLNYSIASNGHIHAKCFSAGECVSWME